MIKKKNDTSSSTLLLVLSTIIKILRFSK